MNKLVWPKFFIIELILAHLLTVTTKFIVEKSNEEMMINKKAIDSAAKSLYDDNIEKLSWKEQVIFYYIGYKPLHTSGDVKQTLENFVYYETTEGRVEQKDPCKDYVVALAIVTVDSIEDDCKSKRCFNNDPKEYARMLKICLCDELKTTFETTRATHEDPIEGATDPEHCNASELLVFLACTIRKGEFCLHEKLFFD